MQKVSISQLKTAPSKIITKANDYPVEIENRNQTQAYILGKDLYEKIVSFVEDFIDSSIVSKTDFSKGKNFEEIAGELGV